MEKSTSRYGGFINYGDGINALIEAAKELKWIRTLLAELGYKNGNNPDIESLTDL